MKFDYKEYEAQQSAKKSNNGNDGPKIEFINGLLKENNGTLVVRFPYHTMEDIQFETTHSVKFPGDKWNKRVRCSGTNCPLCAQGVKLETRFFVKVIAYVVDKNSDEVKLVPAIWDRPSAFADIDIKNKMQDYGDLTKCLFKIKKTGEGLDTRYDMNIITNNVIYNPEIYKADFSILEKIDPVKILTKSMEQYINAINPTAKEETAPVQPEPTPVTYSTRDVVNNYIPNSQPQPEVNPTFTNSTQPYTGYSSQPVNDMNNNYDPNQVRSRDTFGNQSGMNSERTRIRL